MPLRDEILQQALSLSDEDRAYLADVIVQSLGQNEFATPEIAAAWGEEVERRAQAFERGEMSSEDWRSVMKRLRTPRDRKSA